MSKIISFKFRIYPNTIQKQKIDEFLEKHNELSKTELKNVSQENFDLIISELSKLINELN